MEKTKLNTALLVFLLFSLLSCSSSETSNKQYFRNTHVFTVPDKTKVEVYIVIDNKPDSSIDIDGLAHYTEHLAYTAINDEPNPNFGQHSNARTTIDSIAYWKKGEKTDLFKIIQDLYEIFEPLSVSRDFSESERNIVIREYDLRVLENDHWRAEEIAREFLYAGNRSARSVIGNAKNIANFTLDNAIQFHATTHLPKNAALVVIGDVDSSDLIDSLEKAEIPSLTDEVSSVVPQPVFNLGEKARKRFDVGSDSNKQYFTFRRIVPLDSTTDFEQLVLNASLLSDIYNSNLDGGFGKRLYIDDFIVSSFDIGLRVLDEQHVELVIHAQPEKDVSFEKLEKTLIDLLMPSNSTLTQATFDRIHDRMINNLPDWDDDQETAEYMSQYGLSRISSLRTPVAMNELETLSKAITYNDIQLLDSAIRKPGREAVITIGKK